MKNGIFNFLLIGTVFLGFSSAVFSQTKDGKKTIEPTAKESIKQIFLNGDILLSSVESCKSVGTSLDDKTLLDFMSVVLSFQAERESENRIEFSFTKEKGSKNEIIWLCDVMFYNKGEDMDAYATNGVRFKMRNSDRKLIRSSLVCTGTG